MGTLKLLNEPDSHSGNPIRLRCPDADMAVLLNRMLTYPDQVTSRFINQCRQLDGGRAKIYRFQSGAFLVADKAGRGVFQIVSPENNAHEVQAGWSELKLLEKIASALHSFDNLNYHLKLAGRRQVEFSFQFQPAEFEFRCVGCDAGYYLRRYEVLEAVLKGAPAKEAADRCFLEPSRASYDISHAAKQIVNDLKINVSDLYPNKHSIDAVGIEDFRNQKDFWLQKIEEVRKLPKYK